MGMQAGILPRKTWIREYKCEGDVKGLEGLEEDY